MNPTPGDNGSFDAERELDLLARRLRVRGLEEALSFPMFFQVETVRLCNATCTMCAINLWAKDVPFMDDALFEKVATEIGEHRDQVAQVCVQRSGEPLMDKKIHLRVARLKELGIRRVVFSTNGSLMTEKRARRLLDAGIDEVMFSIDSLRKDVYEKRRVGLKLDVVLRNTLRFAELRESLRPQTEVRVRMAIGDDTRDEVREYVGFWRSRLRPSDRVYAKEMHNWGNQVDGMDSCPEHRWPRNPCVSLWSSMNILADGRVALCSLDYDGKVGMGSVRENSIQDVWRGAGFSGARDLHSTGRRNEIPLCRGCVCWDRDEKSEY